LKYFMRLGAIGFAYSGKTQGRRKNGARGKRDIEHVAIGNGAFGQSDPAAAGPRWVAASERSRGDASDIDGQNREVEMGGST